MLIAQYFVDGSPGVGHDWRHVSMTRRLRRLTRIYCLYHVSFLRRLTASTWVGTSRKPRLSIVGSRPRRRDRGGGSCWRATAAAVRPCDPGGKRPLDDRSCRLRSRHTESTKQNMRSIDSQDDVSAPSLSRVIKFVPTNSCSYHNNASLISRVFIIANYRARWVSNDILARCRAW